jgi:hypothetical protein
MKKRKPKVVWLLVSTTDGFAYGGEWEMRRKDAALTARSMNRDDVGRGGAPGWRVQKAVLVET